MKKIVILVIAIIYGGLFIYYCMNRDTKDELYEDIMEYATNNRIEPINATYDIVYKQTPGLSGVDIDVDASYQVMKEKKLFDESLIVYKEIEPVVGLDDIKYGAIYQGNSNKKMVTININVAWGEEYIIQMLEILKKYETKANFFLEGKWAENNKELVNKIYEEEHMIGNHSYSHQDFSKISKDKMIEEIDKTNAIIEEITGEKPIYFAPPSGAYNEVCLEVVKSKNMKMIMWNVDTIDWQKPSKETIINRVEKKVDCGSIILMHPTENTTLALETIILNIIKRGLKIDSLNNFLSVNAS